MGRKSLSALPDDDATMRRFCVRLRGCSAEDIRILGNQDKLYGAVKLFDVIAREAWTPHPSQIPWPIAWVTARFNRKHRATMGRRPNMRFFRDALNMFKHRCRWRIQLGNKLGHTPSIIIPTRKTPICSTSSCEVQAWTNSFVREIASGAEKAIYNSSSWRRACTEPLGLIRLAKATLARHSLVLMQNDKEPGYCVLEQWEVQHEVDATLSSNIYLQVDPYGIERSTLAYTYRKLCKTVEDLEEDPGLAKELCKTLAGATPVAKLKLSVKTHKNAGEVNCRAIHASARYMFGGLGKWVAKQFRLKNCHVSHLLTDRKQFVDRVQSLEVNHGDDMWVHLDVKDFFLSGDWQSITADATVGWPIGPHKAAVRSALEFLLTNQYVASQWRRGEAWQVIKGAGMGLNFSADLMDYLFYSKAEFCLLDRLGEFGIRRYYRYRDDIMICGSRSSRLLVWQFVRRLRELAGYFVVKVESVDYDGCNFLSISTFPGSAHYKCRTTMKETTALARPLGEDSVHFWRVHQRWPTHTLRSMMVLCSDKGVKREYIARFKRFGASSALLQRLEDTCVAQVVKPCRKRDNLVWWCVLPFHPMYANAVMEAARSFNDSRSFKAIIGSEIDVVPCVRISWSNAVPLITNHIG